MTQAALIIAAVVFTVLVLCYMWRAICRVRDVRLQREIEKITPSNAELLEWAERPENQPPESWWNDTTNPFEPE